MKLLWIVPGGVDPSGVERVIPALLWQLERLSSRHELHVVALRQHLVDTEYDLLGAHVHSLAPRRAPALTMTIRAIMRRHGRFDALHALHITRGALAAVLLGRLTGTPTIVTLLGGELAALPSLGYGGRHIRRGRSLGNLVLHTASAVTCQSAFIEKLAQDHGVRAIQIPLGVDREHFHTRATEPAGPPWRLLHVASLNRVKDQPTLLRAFQRVRNAEPETTLDIVGVDTLGGSIARMAESMGLGDAVRFHGHQPWTTLMATYHRAHIVVSTSLHESGPLVALEAATCGAPLVGTRVGYFADWEEAKLASVVTPGDDGALAERIVALLRNPAERHAMAERARAWAERHDADATARDLERLYARLASEATSTWRPSLFRF